MEPPAGDPIIDRLQPEARFPAAIRELPLYALKLITGLVLPIALTAAPIILIAWAATGEFPLS